MDEFNPEVKVMQLRYGYFDGTEGCDPSHKKRNKGSPQPIYLAKLKKKSDEVGDLVQSEKSSRS